MAEYLYSTPTSVTTIVSAEANSLPDDDNCLSTNDIENLTSLKPFIAFEFVLASIDLSSQDNPAVYLYFLNTIDGSNQEDGDGTPTTPARPPEVIIPLREVSAGQRIVITGIQAPPFNFDILLCNRTGAAFAAAGTTLKYRLYSMEDN